MEQENQSEQPRETNSKNEVVLDNWKLILIFFVGLVICVIFFAAGLIVGRHQLQVAETTPPPREDLNRPANLSPSITAVRGNRRSAAPASKETVVEVKPRSAPSLEASKKYEVGDETRPGPSTTQVNTGGGSSDKDKTTVKADSPASEQANEVAGRPATKPESPASTFRVQIAALKSRSEAQAVVAKLKKKGFDAFVVSPKDSSDVYFRVQMGDYTNRAAAQEVILKLQETGENPVLKRQ